MFTVVFLVRRVQGAQDSLKTILRTATFQYRTISITLVLFPNQLKDVAYITLTFPHKTQPQGLVTMTTHSL